MLRQIYAMDSVQGKYKKSQTKHGNVKRSGRHDHVVTFIECIIFIHHLSVVRSWNSGKWNGQFSFKKNSIKYFQNGIFKSVLGISKRNASRHPTHGIQHWILLSHSNTLHRNIIPISGLLLWWHKTPFHYDFEFMLHANNYFLIYGHDETSINLYFVFCTISKLASISVNLILVVHQ